MVLMCMYFGVMVLCVMLRVMCKRYKEFKNSKISYIHYFFLVFVKIAVIKIKNYLKKKI